MRARCAAGAVGAARLGPRAGAKVVPMTEYTGEGMRLEVEEPRATERVLKVEVSSEKVDEEFLRYYRELRKKVRLPGFRPGKVPLDMIRRRMGKEAEEDLLERVLPRYYARALERAALDPVDMPVVRDVHFKEGEAFRFEAKVYVKPPLDVRDYKGIPVTGKPVRVEEAWVDKVVESMREDMAELVSYGDAERAAAKGDVVEAAFRVTVEGTPLDGSREETHLVELGAGKALDEIEAALEGIRRGEEKEVEVVFPEDYPVKELRGKSGRFHLVVHDVKEKRLPEPDDEFARDVGERYQSLEDLRSDIRENFRRKAEELRRRDLREKLRAAVLERNPLPELPAVMVSRQKKTLEEEISREGRIAGRGAAPPPDPERLEEMARRDVAWTLLMEELAAKEGIRVEEAEIRRFLAEEAGRSSMSEQALTDLYLHRYGTLEPIRRHVLSEKVLDFLLEHATVTEEGDGGDV